MKCERCGKELADVDLYCPRCGKAVFEKYMDEEDVWAYYKSDEELARILEEEEKKAAPQESQEAESEHVPEGLQEDGKEPSQVREAVCAEESSSPEQIPEAVSDERYGEEESFLPDTGLQQEAEAQEPVFSREEEMSEESAAEEEEGTPPDLDAITKELPQRSAFEKAGQSLEEEGFFMEESSYEEPDAYEQEEPSEEMDSYAEEAEDEPGRNQKEENLEEPSEIEDENPEVVSLPVSVQGEESEEELYEEDDDLEEDLEDEESQLSPERKKARRYGAAVSCIFLAVCLCIGLYLGYLRIQEMEQEERAYYQNLNGDTQEAAQTGAESEEAEAGDGQPDEQTGEKEQAFQLEDADSVDLSSYNKLTPTGVTGDSEMPSETHDYGPERAADGDIASSWQEGESGLGEGKGLKFQLDGAHNIKCLIFYLGNWRSDELWGYNARPHELTIQIGDEKKDVAFTDEKKKFCVVLENPVSTDSVSITLKSVYKGSRWEDTCISEIEFYEEK